MHISLSSLTCACQQLLPNLDHSRALPGSTVRFLHYAHSHSVQALLHPKHGSQPSDGALVPFDLSS